MQVRETPLLKPFESSLPRRNIGNDRELDLRRGTKSLWFSAKLRFEILRQNSGEREYEERIYLFQSLDQESAEVRARAVGRQHEHEYRTDAGDIHKWRFVEVVRVTMTFLDTPLEKGIEVYSERTLK